MRIDFCKYQATGNDFIMINGMQGLFSLLDPSIVAKFCDRRKGIGADGLIVLKPHLSKSFYMDYYNADGSKSFCGNGARCSVGFAKSLGLLEEEEIVFTAIDGDHSANILSKDRILINMSLYEPIKLVGNDFIANTGSPHYVRFVDHVEAIDVGRVGSDIRNSKPYINEGINVNFVEIIEDDVIRIRTYERGVEAETLSCGTGATACALVFAQTKGLKGQQGVKVKVEGGELEVRFRVDRGNFQDIQLIGPYRSVFQGSIEINDLLTDEE